MKNDETNSSNIYECTCGHINHVFRIAHFEDEVYLDQVYDGHNKSIWGKLIDCYNYIFNNKEVYLTETILSEDEFNKFKKQINSIKLIRGK